MHVFRTCEYRDFVKFDTFLLYKLANVRVRLGGRIFGLAFVSPWGYHPIDDTNQDCLKIKIFK